jgi:hypothetical protein
MWGLLKAGGFVRRPSPYAFTYWTRLHTFDETQRYQLCHYDVVVAQLVALGFITLTGDYTYVHRFMYLLVYLLRYTTEYYHGRPKNTDGGKVF